MYYSLCNTVFFSLRTDQRLGDEADAELPKSDLLSFLFFSIIIDILASISFCVGNLFENLIPDIIFLPINSDF